MDFSPLFKLMAEKEASDMFIAADAPVYFKIKGALVTVAARKVTAEEIDNMISHLISAEDKQLADVTLEKNGLVLIVGGAGSGKSTTLAAMVDYRNSNSDGHIITIEDPIEFVHENKKSLVTQREVGTDSKSYSAALRSALRQAPDVLLIGEVRDRESMEAAISFAETGHLVLGTLHANNAPQTMDRIFGFFPNDMHDMLKLQLSQTLKAVMAQRLVKAKRRNERFIAVEFMTLTGRISDLILKGEFQSLKSAIERSEGQGMITFDESLFQLYKSGKINFETALTNSDSPTDLRLRIRSEEESVMPTNIRLMDEETEDSRLNEENI